MAPYLYPSVILSMDTIAPLKTQGSKAVVTSVISCIDQSIRESLGLTAGHATLVVFQSGWKAKEPGMTCIFLGPYPSLKLGVSFGKHWSNRSGITWALVLTLLLRRPVTLS